MQGLLRGAACCEASQRCVRMYVSVCAHVCLSVCMHMHVLLHVFTRVRTYMHIRVCVHLHKGKQTEFRHAGPAFL